MKCPHCRESILNLHVSKPTLGQPIGGGLMGPVLELIVYTCPKCQVIIDTAVLQPQMARA